MPEFRHLHLEPQLLGAGKARRPVADDFVPRIGEPRRRLPDRRRHVRMQIDSAEIGCFGDDRDAFLHRGSGKRDRTPPWISRVAPGHRGKPEADVRHGAPEQPLHRHELRGHRPLRGLRRVVGGNPAKRRTNAGEPATVRGKTHRARDVVAMRNRCHACGDRGRCAAGRAARRVRFRPRAVGAAAQIVDGVETEAERRRIGAAGDDRAGAFPIGDDRTIGFCNDVLKTNHAVGRGAAFLIDVFLDGHRHAMQRPERIAAGDRLVGGARRPSCRVRQVDGHRVELRVHLGYARETRRERFLGGNLAVAYRACDARGAPAPDVVSHIDNHANS